MVKTILTQTVTTIGPMEVSEKTESMNANDDTHISPMAAKQNARP
jgi:hypothetical protein